MFNTEGRLRRTEFIFQKINSTLIIICAVMLIESIASDAGKLFNDTVRLAFYVFAVPVYFIYDYKITSKRFHDLNKNSNDYILQYIPIYNIIVLFGLFFEKGTNGDNDFGVDPRNFENEKFKGKIIFNLILFATLVFFVSQIK